MKTIPVLLASILILTGTFRLKADSPITSTNFYKAYEKMKIVKYANEKGVIDEKIAKFLLSEKASIDKKAAVINALSWDVNGKSNTQLLINYLEKKHKKAADNIFLEDMTADELFCIGYLLVMDNYFQPENALEFLTLAKEKNPQSYTVNIIHALTQAQVYLDTFEWCKVWKCCNEVNINASLDKDMKAGAVSVIFEYIGLYKAECGE